MTAIPWETMSSTLAYEGFRIFVANLTPEKAEELLMHNPKNRNTSPNHSSRLARQIIRGEWEFNGEAIRIDDKGNLIDGQHRCLAVKNAGKSATVLVVEGLPTEAANTIDTGRARSLIDILTKEGFVDTANLAACARSLYTLQGNPLSRAFDRDRGAARQAYGNPELMKFIRAGGEELIEDVREARVISTKMPGIPASVIIALKEAFADASPHDADEFWRLVTTGEGKQDDPTFTLYHMIRREQERAGSFRTPKWKAAIIIKVWNAYLGGYRPKYFRWSAGGSSPEPFPTVARAD